MQGAQNKQIHSKSDGGKWCGGKSKPFIREIENTREEVLVYTGR